MLLPRERKIIFVLLLMTFVSMIFETLGIGLIIPAVGLLTRPDYVTQFPVVSNLVGNASRTDLIRLGIGALVLVYLLKNMFLVFFLWVQSLFGMKIQMRLSRELFRKYLHLPYVSHLENNSATLIRNI